MGFEGLCYAERDFEYIFIFTVRCVYHYILNSITSLLLSAQRLLFIYKLSKTYYFYTTVSIFYYY